MKIRMLSLIAVILLGVIPNHSFALSGQAGKNGWYDVNGSQYYYQNNQSAKGWISVNGKWYYFNPANGTMVKGWVFYQSKWYYLGSDGVMKTGWLYSAGKWYYFTKDGAMKTGWLFYGGYWYYLSNDGTMKTGWLTLNNQKYFLKVNGAMQIGWMNIGGWNYFNKSGAWVPNTVADSLKSISQNKQLILVTTNSYNTDAATIRTFEKVDNKWYQKMDVTGFIGKYGFAVQMKEGGEKSPRGKYTIGTAFGRYSNPGTKLPYRFITPDDVWVDDPASEYYNTWQENSQNYNSWNSAEKMNIPAYNYGFVINYNTDHPIPGAGSAIFFHVSKSYTLGCTGTDQSNVLSILRWLDPAKDPVIIQTPNSELSNY